MKRNIWIGTAIAIAAVVAIPLWLALDNGGERRAGALTTAQPAQFDCGAREIFPGCRELNSSIESSHRQLQVVEEAQADLAAEVAALQAKGASPERLRAFATESAMEDFAKAAQLASQMQASLHAALMAIISNLKG